MALNVIPGKQEQTVIFLITSNLTFTNLIFRIPFHFHKHIPLFLLDMQVDKYINHQEQNGPGECVIIICLTFESLKPIRCAYMYQSGKSIRCSSFIKRRSCASFSSQLLAFDNIYTHKILPNPWQLCPLNATSFYSSNL